MSPTTSSKLQSHIKNITNTYYYQYYMIKIIFNNLKIFLSAITIKGANDASLIESLENNGLANHVDVIE